MSRSGRGQALLKALGQPIRRPGQQEDEATKTTPTTSSDNVPPLSLAKSSVGRGLRALMLSQKPNEAPPTGRGVTPTVTQMPLVTRAPPVAPRLASLSLDDSPKIGSSGQSIPLSANYLMLQGRSEGVYQYAVAFDPAMESKSVRYSLISSQAEVLGVTRAFDGTTLYLPKKITETTLTLNAVRSTDGTPVTVFITLVAVVNYSNCVQLFNVIFRRVLRHLELQQVGRHFYDPSSPIAIPQHKMELWPGYVSAVQEHDGGLLLLFDVSHRLMRTDSALDFLYELHSKVGDRGFQEQAYKQLVGVVVLTRYNNRTYRVDDIAWDKNPGSTFRDHTGNAVSFIDYYKKAYGKEITDNEQPLLIHCPKRRSRDNQENAVEEIICLIPELCCMTGLTQHAREDFRVMKDVAQHTRIQPNQRDLIFKKFVEKVNKTTKAREELESWGFQLDPRMIQLDGRVLDKEKILFGRNKSILSNDEADWGRDAVREQVITPVPLESWLLVVTKRDRSKAVDFLNMLKRVGPPIGIEVSDAQVIEVPNDRTETYLSAIKPKIVSSLQMVVAIFPTSRDDRYAAFKKLTCVEQPIPSQVINARTISAQQKLRSVTQKIALQMNCKLGGELWAVEIPVKNMMVVGLDVYHDPASSGSGRRSILGFVASTNKHLTRWYSRVSIQGRGQEIADGLKMCVKSALTKYHELNGALPERVVVFRDGVGDGQMSTVQNYEVAQMKEAFSMFGESYSPKMVVVVVQKRISTRIFQRGETKGLGNPPPGTVVDHTFTRKGWYDFFLVSQHVRQGTVMPTHFVVVSDTSGFKPDHIQRLAYKLTHMYYNWPGTIRVPAPCQYAHKLAYLVGQSLHRDPNLGLADRLFFL